MAARIFLCRRTRSGRERPMTGPSGTIRLDASNTRVTFAVRWFGAIVVRGRFHRLQGTLELPGTCLERARLAIDVLAASVRTGIGLRDRHLRGPRFLHASRFPRITFRNTAVQRRPDALLLSGTLSLRGRDTRLTVHCTVRDVAGNGDAPSCCFTTRFRVIRASFDVGKVAGIQRLNPLMVAIGPDVVVEVELALAASRLPAGLRPGRAP